MTTECPYRSKVPRALMGDLDAAELQALERHIPECAQCRREQELYASTLLEMRSLGEEDVPRHFFVYSENARTSPWRLFRRMPLAWQGVMAAAAVILLAVSGAGFSGLHVRAEKGAVTIAFGKLPPVIDEAALEARILKEAGERNRIETIRWVRTLRAEITQTGLDLTTVQRATLEAALRDMEERVDNRITATAQSISEERGKQMRDLYLLVALERERDARTFNTRLDTLAANGELRNTQTDEILETLLQVADLRTSNYSGEKK